MHRLRLPYSLFFGDSTRLVLSAQWTADCAFGSSARTMFGFDSGAASLPTLFDSQATPLLSSGDHPELGVGVLRVRVGPNAFSKGKSVMDDRRFLGR